LTVLMKPKPRIVRLGLASFSMVLFAVESNVLVYFNSVFK
jgi:hypothetical protein